MVAAGWGARDELIRGPLLVAAALTVLQWGVLRAVRAAAPIALALGALAVILAQVALAMPGAAAISGALLAPPLYWLGQSGESAATREALFRRSGPWLLLALFVAAFALR
jgi:hypothetical protein